MRKQTFCFGNWKPFVDKTYSQTREVNFPHWEKDQRLPLVLQKEHLVYNRDGTISSHYTWKSLRNTLREEISRDAYYDHNDFYITFSSDVLQLIDELELQKFATFCYVERWNKKKSKKTKK